MPGREDSNEDRRMKEKLSTVASLAASHHVIHTSSHDRLHVTCKMILSHTTKAYCFIAISLFVRLLSLHNATTLSPPFLKKATNFESDKPWLVLVLDLTRRFYLYLPQL